MLILKKNHILSKYLSCHSTLGRYIHRIYRIEIYLHISPSVLSRGSCKFCRLPSSCSSSLLSSFGQAVALPRWTWLLLLQRYFITDNRAWWYLLSSFSPLPPPQLQRFRPDFAVTNLWVSRSLRQLRVPGVQRVIVTVKRITVKVK